MELGARLGQGRLGEVFAYGSDKAVKLFYPDVPRSVIEHEYRMASIVNRFNLPIARVMETLNLNNRFGIVYERIEGKTFLQHILAGTMEVKEAAIISAELHSQIHTCVSDELPSQRELFAANIRESILDEASKDQALTLLNNLEDSDHVCHGDFHPDNIVLSLNGPVILDWANARRGNPIADMVLSSLILKIAALPDFIEYAGRFNTSKRVMYQAYTSQYMKLTKVGYEDMAKWIVPVAVTRLKDQIDSEQEVLLRIISKFLHAA